MTETTSAATKAGRRWIFAIVGLLVGNVLAGVVLITAAHHGASRVLPGYYERAVHYDDRIDQEARNRALAWRVEVVLDHGRATVTASDPHGQPIVGARVRIEGIERAATARTISAELTELLPGTYRAPIIAAGWLDLAVTVERGAEHYQHPLALEVR